MSTKTEAKRHVIMRNVKQTCTELAGKFEQLHRKVIKPVEEAKDAVSNTVETVTGTVSSAKHVVEQVVETVSEQVVKRPWVAILGSMTAGVGAGLLTGGWISNSSTDENTTSHSSSSSNGFASHISSSPSKPGFLSSQLKKLTGVAVGAGLAVVRDLVKDKIPAWAEAADSITNDITEQLGAVPFKEPILPHSNAYSPSVN